MNEKITIIAEIGHNWNTIREAKKLISLASETGCDYAKFQLYATDKIKKRYESNYGELKRAELTRDQAAMLVEACNREKIKPLFSVFDEERLEWVKSLGVATTIKLAMRSTVDQYLLSSAVGLGSDLICSFGSSAQLRSFKTAFPEASKRSMFLFCVSRRQIMESGLVECTKFDDGYFDGISDHSIGVKVAKRAIDNGARVIEKHITFDCNGRGWDQPGSADPDMLRELVTYARRKQSNIGA